VTTNARREFLAPTLMLIGATAVLLWWLGAPGATAQTDQVTLGRELFISGCSSCHGNDGHGATGANGQVQGPSLVKSGAAGAYFQLSTGRMPAATTGSQVERKPTVYSTADIGHRKVAAAQARLYQHRGRVAPHRPGADAELVEISDSPR